MRRACAPTRRRRCRRWRRVPIRRRARFGSRIARCARRSRAKAFRRLKHKTQVFVAPEGDHYRTRLTHTLEATQISRTVARALRLNEDLTEAIGLGHDVGHPPFGHLGAAGPGARGHDLVEHSERAGDIVQGDEVGAAMVRLRSFMFESVYLGPTARAE